MTPEMMEPAGPPEVTAAPEAMAADRESERARALLRTGLVHLRREEFSDGLAAIDAAIDARPEMADAHAYRSSALMALSRPLEAQDEVEIALALDPNAFAPQQKAGEMSLRLGDMSAAADHFLAAVRAARPGSPDEAAAQAGLVLARRRMKSGIDHHAVLPRRPALPGPVRSIAGRLRRASRRAVPG